MSIKILISDDHKIIREGLRSLIAQEPDMEIVAEAENGRIALDMVQQLSPDIIIMDVTMPDMNGIEATKKILTDCPQIKVIALSMHSDKRYVTEMLNAGAMGYLLKDCAFEELTHAIRTVIDNRTYLSPGIAGIVIEDYIRNLPLNRYSASTVLTSREREVLQLIAEGMTTKQIAARLNVSTKTIETHRRQIMDKLNIHSIAELTKFAIREGLTSLDN